MKKIIFHVLLTLSFGQFLSAQNRVLTSCNSGQYSMVAAWSDKFQGVIFYADNSVTKEIDTLLLAYPGSFDIQCQCNDTSSTFFIDDNSPILEHFTFERGSWNCSIKSITLPPKFPLVGCLIDGKKYESYKYRLDSQDEISAELEIKVANNELGRLITTERYYAKFIIDYDKGVYKMTKQLRE